MDSGAVNPLQLLETLHEGVVVHGPDTQILYANPRALELMRLTEEQALGRDVLDKAWHFVDSLRRPLPLADYPVNRVLIEQKPVFNLEVGVCDSSSAQETWVLCNAYPQFDEAGNIEKVVVSFLDISAQKKSIPFEAVVEHANDAIVVTEAYPLKGSGPRIVYVNQAFSRLTGYSADEIIGLTPRVLQGKESDTTARRRISVALQEKRPVREQILNYAKNGEPYWVELNIVPLANEQGEVNYFAAIERDITRQKMHEAELTRWANKDALTGLMNRRGFEQAATTLLRQAQELQQSVTVAVLDLDYFKQVNDSFGHAAGDKVLVDLALQLRQAFRTSDLIGRMGGEEFVVLLPGMDAAQAAVKLEDCRSRVARYPFELPEGEFVEVTLSVGHCTFNAGEYALEAAVSYADQALYNAKAAGRNRVKVFKLQESENGD